MVQSQGLEQINVICIVTFLCSEWEQSGKIDDLKGKHVW